MTMPVRLLLVAVLRHKDLPRPFLIDRSQHRCSFLHYNFCLLSLHIAGWIPLMAFEP